MQRYINALASAQTGLPLVGAAVLVQLYPSGTTAVIYAVDSTSTPVANPLGTDVNGQFSFYAANGRYQLTITPQGGVPYTLTDILLSDELYQSSAAGSVPRSYASKLGDIVSVLDFGADPTGVADSTAAFNAAAVKAGTNGQVLIPLGIYQLTSITANLTWLETAGTTFIGAGSLGGRIVEYGNGGTYSHGTKLGAPSSWLEQIRVDTESSSELDVLSTIGQIAVLGGSRTSDSSNSGSNGSIGVTGFQVNNNAINVQTGYGAYFEARQESGAGITIGVETDIANQSGVSVVNQPYSMGIPNSTMASWLASGAGLTGLTPATMALGIINNGSSFNSGIVFGANSLTGDDGTTGQAPAIVMAKGHTIQWYGSANIPIGSISNTVANAANSTFLTMADGGMFITGNTGQVLVLVPSIANAVNEINLLASITGNPVQVIASGSDANIGINLISKGSGAIAANGKTLLSTSDTTPGQTPVAITVGASPFAYTATYGGSVSVSGGTVSNLALSRGGTTVWNTTLSSDVIPVRAGDIVTITYTIAPTVYQLSN